MKVILAVFVTMFVLCSCGQMDTQAPSPSPTPKVSPDSNSIKNYDENLTEGTLVAMEDGKIKIKDLDDDVEKEFPAVDKAFNDIQALEIAIGDRVIIKQDNGKIVSVEKVL